VSAGTNVSSYNRYTYYRLLGQLGTDSAPEPTAKMNLNFDNLVVGNFQTGFRSAIRYASQILHLSHFALRTVI
jgi:hypothetical protein